MNIKTLNKNVKKLTSFAFNNKLNLLKLHFLSVVFIIQQIFNTFPLDQNQ